MDQAKVTNLAKANDSEDNKDSDLISGFVRSLTSKGRKRAKPSDIADTYLSVASSGGNEDHQNKFDKMETIERNKTIEEEEDEEE